MSTGTNPNTSDLQKNLNPAMFSAKNGGKLSPKMIINNTHVFNKAVLEDMLRAKKIQEEESKIFRDKSAGSTGGGSDSPVKWIKKDDKIIAAPSVSASGFTNVNCKETSIKAPDILSILGLKIDIKSKKDSFIENYKKNYVLSKSYNMLMAKFAALKVGFYGMMLSLVGVKADEIRDIQKEARKGALEQNKMLFEENEYAGELLAILGGSKKQVKAQNQVISEVRKQIMKQCEQFGRKDHFDQNKIAEVRLEQSQKILEGFKDERETLAYKLSMHEFGIAHDDEKNETEEKLLKINGLVQKAQRLVELRQKEFNMVSGKKPDERQKV